MTRVVALLLAGALLVPNAPALASPDAGGARVVYCHDTARQLVQRVRLRHCQGRVVTSQEAAQLHTQIEADRRARRNRTIQQSTQRKQRGFRFKSAGAAFAINRQGELLTSAHVVRGCDALEARNDVSPNARPARVKAISKASDLAVIRIDVASPAILRFSPTSPSDGAPLALIGYPSEGMIRRVPRMTPVLISHAVSDPTKYGLIGVAGEVRRGNSGGPALDSRGRAVGVLKAKIDTVAAKRLTGRMLTNLGVIVDTGRVLRFLEASQTRYSVDGSRATEKTGRALFEDGRRAVYRIDCLVRN